MDKQEVFDKVVAYAKTMKKRSTDNSMKCYYLSPTGNQCFVGIFLTPEQAEYADDDKIGSRGTNWLSVSERRDAAKRLPAWMLEPDMVEFLRRLQRAHDRARTVRDLMPGLAEVARAHKLTFNEKEEEA
jgi:hypothetical protein